MKGVRQAKMGGHPVKINQSLKTHAYLIRRYFLYCLLSGDVLIWSLLTQLSLKIDLVSYPARAEGLVNRINSIELLQA